MGRQVHASKSKAEMVCADTAPVAMSPFHRSARLRSSGMAPLTGSRLPVYSECENYFRMAKSFQRSRSGPFKGGSYMTQTVQRRFALARGCLALLPLGEAAQEGFPMTRSASLCRFAAGTTTDTVAAPRRRRHVRGAGRCPSPSRTPRAAAASARSRWVTADPDGYTLSYVYVWDPLAINASVFSPAFLYGPRTDVTPIAFVGYHADPAGVRLPTPASNAGRPGLLRADTEEGRDLRPSAGNGNLRPPCR